MEGAVAEQVETVWTGLRERHVGQIWGKGAREEKKNPAVPAKQGSEMKYRETSADAQWSQFALQRLFCGFREAALSWDKAL